MPARRSGLHDQWERPAFDLSLRDDASAPMHVPPGGAVASSAAQAVARNADRLRADCAGLLAYAGKRLGHCPYGPAKPTCVNCPIHCYGKRQREQVRDVMRYAGPRMLARHPWLAIAPLIDGRRPVPPRPGEGAHAAAVPPDAQGPRNTPGG